VATYEAVKQAATLSTEQSIRKYICDNILFSGGRFPIGDDESFIERNVVDSTGVLELQLFVEETYGFQVREDEVLPENFDSVTKLASFIRRKQQAHR
jgi:acyl carrier protein